MYKSFVGRDEYQKEVRDVFELLGAGLGERHVDAEVEAVLICALETLRNDAHAPIVKVDTNDFFSKLRAQLNSLGLASVSIREIFPPYLDGYLHTHLFYSSIDPELRSTDRESDMEAEANACLYEYFKALWNAEPDPNMRAAWAYLTLLFD